MSTSANILITGASSGIGKALTHHYAQKGDKVYACGRNEDRLQALERLSSNIQSIAFDITNSREIKNKTAQVDDLDILVLNAGTCEYINDPKNFDGDLFARIINTNLISIGYCLQHLLPKISHGGQLVFVSSSAAFLPLPRAEAYGASKAGLSYLAKTLAIDLKSRNIDVSLVHPGFVQTPLTDKNDFPMPMKISAQQAATIISTGITKRRTEIHFPKLFTYMMKLLALMPFSCWRRFAAKQLVARGDIPKGVVP